MPKGKRQIGGNDPRQMSLLDLLQRAQDLRPPDGAEGSHNVHTRLCHALTRAINEAVRTGLLADRYDLAAKMSRLLGMEITKYQIDGWTAESKDAHRIPAEFLPAFCAATGAREPLQILTDVAGLFCLPGPEALRAEIQKLREEEKKVGAERRKRELFLQQMEGEG